jgi:hypothetical protein
MIHKGVFVGNGELGRHETVKVGFEITHFNGKGFSRFVDAKHLNDKGLRINVCILFNGVVAAGKRLEIKDTDFHGVIYT